MEFVQIHDGKDGDIGFFGESLDKFFDEIEGHNKAIEIEDEKVEVIIIYEFNGYTKVYFNKKCQETNGEDYYIGKTKDVEKVLRYVRDVRGYGDVKKQMEIYRKG